MEGNTTSDQDNLDLAYDDAVVGITNSISKSRAPLDADGSLGDDSGAFLTGLNNVNGSVGKPSQNALTLKGS